MSDRLDRLMYDIGPWGLPRKITRCPSCGSQYGAYKRKVCVKCGECSKCCSCDKPDLKPAEEAIPIVCEGEY